MNTITRTILMTSATLAALTQAHASVDMFLKIEDVKGEKMCIVSSQDPCEGAGVLFLRESPTRASTGQTSVRESPSRDQGALTEVRESPTKKTYVSILCPDGDCANMLRQACAQGKHFKKVTLTMITTEGGKTVTNQYTLQDCFVTALHEIKSPRDAASGLATGKRMHKPISLRCDLEVSSILSDGDPFVLAKDMQFIPVVRPAGSGS